MQPHSPHNLLPGVLPSTLSYHRFSTGIEFLHHKAGGLGGSANLGLLMQEIKLKIDPLVALDNCKKFIKITKLLKLRKGLQYSDREKLLLRIKNEKNVFRAK